MGIKREIEGDEELGVGAEEVAPGECGLDGADTVVGEVHRSRVRGHLVVRVRGEGAREVGDGLGVLVEVVLAVRGEHERHPGLVEQHGIRLV